MKKIKLLLLSSALALLALGALVLLMAPLLAIYVQMGPEVVFVIIALPVITGMFYQVLTDLDR
jgi:hypothetical protein